MLPTWAASLACEAEGTPAKTGDEAVDSSGESAPPEETGTPEETAGESGEPCTVEAEIHVSGDPFPGETLSLTTLGAVSWALPDGSSVDGTEAAWLVGEDLALHQDEDVEVTATRCDGTELTTALTVTRPAGDRVVVLYDPDVVGSLDVANAYADFRSVPAENLCPVSSADPTTLTAGEFDAFLDAVQACVHEWTHYLVPVYGVPYKLSGQVYDIGYPDTLATVSLDAMLFSGEDARGSTSGIWNPIYRDGDSTTGTYDDLKPIGEIRERRDDAYLVARIDGTDAAAAIDLIDRTLAAEEAVAAGGLGGTVYVDGQYGDEEPDPAAEFGSYEWGEWNMWGTRHVFEDDAAYDVVWDGNGAEFGTDPAPTSCPDALYYAGWYSYYNYNDCFDWNVGAIGGHLDSCSACDIRQAGTWAGSALLDGITATFGAVNEPYVAGMPEYDQFFLYLLQGGTYGEAAYESTVVGQWMMVWVGDPLYRPRPDGSG